MSNLSYFFSFLNISSMSRKIVTEITKYFLNILWVCWTMVALTERYNLAITVFLHFLLGSQTSSIMCKISLHHNTSRNNKKTKSFQQNFYHTEKTERKLSKLLSWNLQYHTKMPKKYKKIEILADAKVIFSKSKFILEH